MRGQIARGIGIAAAATCLWGCSVSTVSPRAFPTPVTTSPLTSSSANIYPPANVPGAVDPKVTQANIHQTICVPGYTATVRPPVSYTNPIKARLMTQLHLPGRASDYELDHDVAIEVGGSPRDLANLWMEPLVGEHGARRKDSVENRVHDDICSGKLTLAQGQEIFLTRSWFTAVIP